MHTTKVVKVLDARKFRAIMSALPNCGRKAEQNAHLNPGFPEADTDTRSPPDHDVELSGYIKHQAPAGWCGYRSGWPLIPRVRPD